MKGGRRDPGSDGDAFSARGAHSAGAGAACRDGGTVGGSTSDPPGDPETSLHASTIQDDSMTPDEHALSGRCSAGSGLLGPKAQLWIPESDRRSHWFGSDAGRSGRVSRLTAAVGQVQAIQYSGRGGEVVMREPSVSTKRDGVRGKPADELPCVGNERDATVRGMGSDGK